jgi:acyl carrier protein
MDEIRNKLQDIIRDIFDDPHIVLHNETTAKDVEGWNSLTHIMIVVTVESEFGIQFETAEVSELKNIGDFVELIQKKLKNK